VIDSTLLVAAERGQVDLEALRRRHAGEPFVLAAITASELLEASIVRTRNRGGSLARRSSRTSSEPCG